MRFSELPDKILTELGSILQQVSEKAVEELIDGILSADRVFITGTGRSGLSARSFAMRLMQIGLRVHVVGEVTTPAIRSKDLLIAISGSGETKITHLIASSAKSFGARVFLLTQRAGSSIGELADLTIVLPCARQPVLPLKSAFESSAYILLDAVIMLIMEKIGVTQQEMMERHSNLE